MENFLNWVDSVYIADLREWVAQAPFGIIISILGFVGAIYAGVRMSQSWQDVLDEDKKQRMGK